MVGIFPLYTNLKLNNLSFKNLINYGDLVLKMTFTLENHKYYAYYKGHVSIKNQGASILKGYILIKTSKWN